MTQEPHPTFRLRHRADSGSGVYFDIYVSGESHTVATVLLGDRGPGRLKVVHPAYFYRLNREVAGPREQALVAWLSDLAVVNAALAEVEAPAVRHVAWTESVSIG